MATDSNPIALGVSILGLIWGSLSWVFQLKIKHDILENNDKIDEQLNKQREQNQKDHSSLREDFVRELNTTKEKLVERLERLDRDVTEIKSSLSDRVLTTVNGKYLRTDLHNQTMASINDRFMSMKELLEVTLDKIEDTMERQVADLKERIIHNKP
jgi:hypothetical protein